MSSYSYTDTCPIQRIHFKKSEGGQLRAYMEASSSADPQTLANIKAHLMHKDWQITPYSYNGKPTLEVLGMRSEAQFITECAQKGWVSGKPSYIADQEEKLSFKEIVRKRSLGVSGIWFLSGDAAFSTYGYKGGSLLNLLAGLFYGGGTVSLLTGGRKDQSDLQVRDVANKLSHYMKENGHKLDESCSLEAINNDHEKGTLQKLDEFVRRYPSEMMNVFFAVAGVCIAMAAHKQLKAGVTAEDIEDVLSQRLEIFQKKAPNTIIHPTDLANMHKEIAHKVHVNHKRESWLDIGLGGMTALSGLFAASVKEKAPDPDAPPKHGIDAIWEKIHAKPLAIAGVGYMVSTMCHAASTAIAWKYSTRERKKSIPFRGWFVVSNLVAEALLSISSKGHGDGVVSDTAVDDTIVALAAETIAKQPKMTQNAVIEGVSQFLGRPDVLALNNEEIKQKLTEQVERMRGNPWSVCGTSRDANHPAVPARENNGWQARALAESKTTQPPHLSA